MVFDEDIQNILDLQDKETHDISKDDLIEAYWDVSEKLERKPSMDDINEHGLYRIGRYVSAFGAWIKFLREIGEVTESSYHYPQGFHLGHMLYILQVLGTGNISGSYLDRKYVRIRGGLDNNELGRFQRQVKYKLQGMMEIGLVVDDRHISKEQEDILLTDDGKQLYKALKPLIDKLDFSFKKKEGKDYSTEFIISADEFRDKLKNFLFSDGKEKELALFRKLMYRMDAIKQLMDYLYKDVRKPTCAKKSIQHNFFQSPAVIKYCERNGIEPPTNTAAEHRVPFLLNTLEAMGVLESDTKTINVYCMLLGSSVIRISDDEDAKTINERKQKILSNSGLSADEIVRLKERLGADFLTDSYYIKKFELIEED